MFISTNLWNLACSGPGDCTDNCNTEEHSLVLGSRFSFGAPSKDFRKDFFVLKNWEINRSSGQEGSLISVGHWPKTRILSLLI